MSELTTPIRIDIPGVGSIESADLYIKSEADKVISEKDAEIEQLEILCATYRHDCDNLAISNDQAKRAARTLLEKMNYNKYKRCLAMARWCRTSARSDEILGAFKYRDWYWKWFKRWLAMADKYK